MAEPDRAVLPLDVKRRIDWPEVAAGVLIVLVGLATTAWAVSRGGLTGALVAAFWALVIAPACWQRLRGSFLGRTELVITPSQIEIWHDGALKAPIVVPVPQIDEVEVREPQNGDAPRDAHGLEAPVLGEGWEEPDLVVTFRLPVAIVPRGMWSKYGVAWGPSSSDRVWGELDAIGLRMLNPADAAQAMARMQGVPISTGADTR